MNPMDDEDIRKSDGEPSETPSPEEPGKDGGKPDGGRKSEDKQKKNIYDQYRYWGNDGKSPKGSPGRNRIALIALILVIVSFAYIFLMDTGEAVRTETSYSRFIDLVENDAVSSVTIVEDRVVNYTLISGEEGTCRIPYHDSTLLGMLRSHSIDVSGAVQPTPLWYIIIQLLPWVIFIVMIVMIMRQTGAAGGNRMMSSFGKSHAQLYGKNDKKVTFADVAGQKEAKNELQEVVDFLRHPDRFVKIGARIRAPVTQKFNYLWFIFTHIQRLLNLSKVLQARQISAPRRSVPDL